MTTMRKVIPVVFSALLIVGFMGAQQPQGGEAKGGKGKGKGGGPAAEAPPAPAPEGIPCFENLAAPDFPRAALQAHVDGSVWSFPQVNSQGMLEKVDTQVVSA